jgi:hypothetical protein
MKDYSDILNRKKTSDKLGDAFTDQANSMRPMNVGQRREQALLRGLGVGLNSDDEREAKLAELENMSKELSMNKYALEMQSGKNELTKQKNLAFFNENQAALSQLSEYIYAGKHSEVDMLAPEILKSYGDITGNKIGKFNHYKNGYATFIDDSGEPKTINIKNLIQPVMDLLPPDQKKEYRGFLSPLQNADIDRMVKAQELQMEKYQADIEASRAHAELYKSQANPDLIAAEMDYKKAQAEKLRQTDISKEQQHVSKEITNSNFKYIDENFKKISTNKRVIEAYKKIDKLMSEESNSLWNREGSGFISTLQRWSDPSITDANVRQARIELEKMPLWGEFKEIFGAKASDQDLKAFLTTMPDLNKPYKANKEAILGRIEDLEQSTFNIENTIDILEKSNYLTHHSNSSVRRELEERNNKRKEDILLDNGNNVKMKDKNNKIYYIPKNDVDKAINDGLEKYE